MYFAHDARLYAARRRGADVDGLRAIVRACPDTLTGDRDKALTLTGSHYASRSQDPAGGVRYPGQFGNNDYSGGASLARESETTRLSFLDVSDNGLRDKATKAAECAGP